MRDTINTIDKNLKIHERLIEIFVFIFFSPHIKF